MILDARQVEFRAPRVLLTLVLVVLCGCMSADRHREKADRVAQGIIEEKQTVALGRTEPFTIEPPQESLRARLLEQQHLPRVLPLDEDTKEAGAKKHWRERLTPEQPRVSPPSSGEGAAAPEPLRLSLTDTLQVSARHSRSYQSAKEAVFSAALSLDLARDEFTNTFAGTLESIFEYDSSDDPTVRGTTSSTGLKVTRTFRNGVELTGKVAVDLATLLSQGGASSLGILADTSVSVPLLRGSGRDIAAEGLTQAERDVVYALYTFERFRRRFAVSVASEYFGVLLQRQQLSNIEDNYRRLVAATRRARREADAGRLPEFQYDQAVQDELRARVRWISATQSYASAVDDFKVLLGLPADAHVQFDDEELQRLAEEKLESLTGAQGRRADEVVPAADAAVVLREPDREGAGGLEIDPDGAVRIALLHRLDLRKSYAEVADAQRAVAVAADALRAELTLFGSASFGGGRSVSSAGSADVTPRVAEGSYSALLTLDLPLERTSERKSYRASLISLASAKRDLEELEDGIKLAVRGTLRDLLEDREGVKIQAQAVALAERRVNSMDLLLQAGRAQIRDVLDAQDDLLEARNSLADALVSYRIAELVLQRDMGVLQVDADGLWREYIPGEADDDKR